METKVVVWEAIKIGIELEKMFRGAEIEKNLLVSSKFLRRHKNHKKGHHIHNFGF